MNPDKTLCQELYKVSGWQPEDYCSHEIADNNGSCAACGKLRPNDPYAPFDPPAYTSDYLLDKLPTNINNRSAFYLWKTGSGYKAGYEDALLPRRPSQSKEIHRQADTPVNALLKLAIELFKSGILGKGGLK